MNLQKNEQSANDASRAELIEPIHASKPAVVKRKRWHFPGLIVLISLGVIAVIVYLLRSELADKGRYEGILIALGAITCGGFLVRHAIRVMAEEDELEEQQFNANEATVSPAKPNSAGHETNLAAPPPESGQNFK